MKQAYLIMAHNEWQVLSLLLQVLDEPMNDVYLHIDSRVAPLPQLPVLKHAGFHLLTNRHRVVWGDYSQVEAEYALFREAYGNGHYLCYHLLSGVDMPLRSQHDIFAFFKQHEGRNFVGLRRTPVDVADMNERWSYHFPFMSFNKRNLSDTRPRVMKVLMTALRHAVTTTEKMLHLRRNRDVEIVKCHQWVTLSHEAVGYLLEHEAEVQCRFHATLCPDEAFVATMLWNCYLRETLFDTTDDDRHGSMRFIDWQRGTPYLWQEGDVDELLASPYMFARKMSLGAARALHDHFAVCSR